MQIKEVFNQGLKRQNEVFVEPEMLNKVVDKIAEKVAQKVKIDGFRPGKAPLIMVKQQYNDNIRSRTVEYFAKKSLYKILDEKNIIPAYTPELSITKFDENTGFEFKVKYELLPEVQDIDFSKIEVTKYTYEPTKEEAKKAKEDFLKANGTLESIGENRQAQEGDFIKLNMVTKNLTTGETFEDQDVEYELGSAELRKEFSDKVVGMKVGEARSFELEYKNDKFEYKVDLVDICKLAPAKIDEKFLAGFNCTSEEDLEQKFMDNYKKVGDSIIRLKFKKDLFDKLVEDCNFEVPEGYLKKEASMIKEAANDDPMLKSQTPEEIRKLASRRVKLGIYIADVAKKHNITVTNEDIQNYIVKYADQGMPYLMWMMKEIEKGNEQVIAKLQGEVLEEKIVDFISTKIKINESKVTREELLKFEE